MDSPVNPQAPKPKPVAKPAPAPKAPPKAKAAPKAAAKPKPKPAPKPKKREAWETDSDEESDGFVGSDSDDDNFASSAPVAPRARSGRAVSKKTYQFDSDDDAAEDDDGDFPMTQETVEAPRPAPMEESDEEFVRAGVVTSARRRATGPSRTPRPSLPAQAFEEAKAEPPKPAPKPKKAAAPRKAPAKKPPAKKKSAWNSDEESSGAQCLGVAPSAWAPGVVTTSRRRHRSRNPRRRGRLLLR